MIEQVLEIVNTEISDMIDGPFEGEDYWTEDEFMYVGNKNLALAAKILRKINQSTEFDKRFVKMQTAGDVIVLGFDSLADVDPVFTKKIGPKNSQKLVELKENENGRIAIYINKERGSQSFKTIKDGKSYIKKLDANLQEAEKTEEPEEDFTDS